MATKATAKKTPVKKTAAKKSAATKAPAFTAEERAAMKDRAAEAKAARAGATKDDDTAAVLAKLAEMPQPDRDLGERVHELVTSTAPDLAPRLYYGMPAYSKDGKVLCWFKPASKFKSRYALFEFSDVAALDDGAMWPTSYAVTTWSPAIEKQVRALVKKAAG